MASHVHSCSGRPLNSLRRPLGSSSPSHLLSLLILHSSSTRDALGDHTNSRVACLDQAAQRRIAESAPFPSSREARDAESASTA